ncbi:hypothetical protein ACIQXW_15255 [Lysinibacillus sp. NPDC097162]|uniref:hypothetical protein n=1 Tax=Lysinibacillus sp. NPDC097162 TaxID=3364140 RepID=UPI00382C92DE
MMSQEKLDILNSMKIIDEDYGGGELVYVHVEYSEENIEKLSKVVPDINEYLKNVGDPDGTKEGIDISIAAFEHAGADYYFKSEFVVLTKEQLVEMYEEEKGKRLKVENELKSFTLQFKFVKEHIQKTLNALS